MNQRRHVRHVVTPRLYVAMSGSSAGGILHDVSDGGVALDIVGSTPAAERVLLDFDMSETGEHFEGLGQIIWKNDSANRIGVQFVNLPDASRHKVRNWLSAKSTSHDTLQNVVVQDRGDGMSVETPPWIRERIVTPAVSAVLERPEKEDLAIPAAAARAQLKTEFEPVSSSRYTTDEPPNEKDDHPFTESRGPVSRTLDAEPLLGQGVPPEDISPGRVAYSWNDLRRLMIIVAIICLAIILVALGIRVLKTGSAYHSVKSLVESLLSPSASVRVASPKVSTSAPSRAPRTSVDKITDLSTANKAATADQFEVMDAQNGRRYLPRTGTNVVVQFEKSRPLQPGDMTPRLPASVLKLFSAPLSDITRAKMGRVSQQFSGELPVVETIPEYPTFALQTNVEGRVVLSAIVGIDGTLHNEHVVSSPSMLDSTVLDAVKKWRYHPHYENGKAVEVETQITVDFSITTE